MLEINKVYNLDVFDFLKQIEDNSIDFIITDPPYYINEEVSVIRRSNDMKYKGKDLDFKKDTEWDRQWKSKSEYLRWLFKILKEYKRILKKDKHLLLFCDKKDFSFIGYKVEKLGFKFRTPLFFKKSNPVPQARKISPNKTIEICLWLTNGKPRVKNYNWQIGMISDVIECAIPQKEGSIIRHPTQKPLFFALVWIAFLSKPNDIILDSFSGSGTFLIASKVLSRNFIGNEINKNYFNASVYRILNNESLEYAINIAKKVREYLLKLKPKSVSIDEFDSLFGLYKNIF